MYACVVGTDVAHAHLVAHLEVREEVPIATFAPGDSKGLAIIAGTVAVLAFLLLVLTLYIFRRCRMERFKKQQAIRVSRESRANGCKFEIYGLIWDRQRATKMVTVNWIVRL